MALLHLNIVDTTPGGFGGVRTATIFSIKVDGVLLSNSPTGKYYNYAFPNATSTIELEYIEDIVGTGFFYHSVVWGYIPLSDPVPNVLSLVERDGQSASLVTTINTFDPNSLLVVNVFVNDYLPSINVSISNPNGSFFIDPNRFPLTYKIGSVVKITAVPDLGWRTFGKTGGVSSWGGVDNAQPVDGASNIFVGDNSIQFVVTEEMNIFITFFEQLITLSTFVEEGKGTLQQGNVPPIYITDETNKNHQSIQYKLGSEVTVIATPDPDWEIDEWEFGNNTSGTVLLNSSKYIGVKFKRSSQYLTYFVNIDSILAGAGCVRRASGGSCVPSENIKIPAEALQLVAQPNAAFRVLKWGEQKIINGTTFPFVYTTTRSNYYTIEDMSNQTIVEVFFEVKPILPQVILTVNVLGGGAISPSNVSSYDLDDPPVEATLIPIAAYGSQFVTWRDLTTDMTLNEVNGVQVLTVPMLADTVVTAVFEPIPDFGIIPQNEFYYCSSENYQTNVINFTHDNNSDESKRFHFRVTFYSEETRTNVVYSAFSLLNNKRWYIEDNFITQLSSDGVVVTNGKSVNILYDPEVLPQDITERQRIYDTDNYGSTEVPLICGIQYYVDIEIYDSSLSSPSIIERNIYTFSCDSVKSNYWSDNLDKQNWLCSGQKGNDLKITDSGDQSLYADVSSNILGYFLIVWQSKRGDKNYIYGGLWDSDNDKLFTSGQGSYDTLYLSNGHTPFVLSDQAQNFYISSNTKNNIHVYKCAMPTTTTELPAGDSFDSFCYPGYDQLLDIPISELRIRIYEEDLERSLIVNENKVIPVINKRNIRLDIIGIPGVYAVRLRNSEDATWSDWINIDSDLYVTDEQPITETDVKYNSYFIDSDRFVVPWTFSRINGIRRVCCQVLTFYGISKTLCMDVFVNIDILDYKLDFYTDSDMIKPVVQNNGFSILSENKTIDNLPLDDDIDTIIYMKVTFSSEQTYEDNELKFNVIQQGIGDLFDLNLLKINSKEYNGEFVIRKDDGVFNKDGIGFISVVFPETFEDLTCASDISDKYNLMVNKKDLEKFEDADPETVFKEYQSGNISKFLDINSLKQYYNNDDDDFKFGNPSIFRDN